MTLSQSHNQTCRCSDQSPTDHHPQTLGRREALAAGVLLSCAPFISISARAASNTDTPIDQPSTQDDTAFMDRAFAMRQRAIDQGDQPFGAVIVRDRLIVGQSWSRVILDQDPTAHAEISAIRDAARRLNSRALNGTIMYSSSPPCPMCEAAAYWAGIGELVHGRNLTRSGPPSLCG